MKPSAPRTLVNFAQILRTDFAPQLQSFSAGNAGMIANMLDMIAEDWDRAADRLVKENAEIRAVLTRGAALLPGSGEAADGGDSDLRVSALEAENERLRTRLTELHAAAELAEGAEARAIEEAIWAILRRSVDSRRMSIANF